jgi:catechol 2,3-dioxygenase-like lactoylglutathione lyase family enzyme
MARPASLREDTPVAHGLTDVIIGARSLQPWRQLGTRLGYQTVVDGNDHGHIAEGARAVVLAAPGTDSGRLRILEHPDATHRRRPQGTDIGLFDLDIYARDLDAFYSQSADDLTWVTPPGEWSITNTPVRLTQGLLLAPDNVNLVPVQAGPNATWLNAWKAHPALPFSEVSSAIAIVADMDASIRFWADGLGFDLIGDFQLAHPFLDQLLTLRPGTSFRMAILAAGDQTARVELIHVPGDALDRTNEAQPGAAGIIAWGMLSDDLAGDLDRMITAGGKLERSNVDVDDAVHGRATVMTVRTVDNNLLELWQPLPGQ